MKKHKTNIIICGVLLVLSVGVFITQAKEASIPKPEEFHTEQTGRWAGVWHEDPKPEQRTPETASVPFYYNKLHLVYLARIKERPIGLLFLGDSITHFWPGRASWEKFAHYNPANFGISGETTEELLWRITNGELDGINPNPKVVVVLIGTNNIGHYREEEPEWVASGIKKIVETVHTKLPNSKVLLIGVLPRDLTHEIGGNAAPLKVAQINSIIKSLDDGWNVTFVDLTSVFTDRQGKANRKLLSDGLHPNDKGYEAWYKAISPVLSKMIQ